MCQHPVVGGRGLLGVEGGLEGGDSKSNYSVQALVWSAHAVYYHLGGKEYESTFSQDDYSPTASLKSLYVGN